MITLQFDTKFGFGMKRYDKLHIFTGSIENYGQWRSKVQNTPSFTSFNDAVQWAKSHVKYALDQNEFEGKKTNVMKAFNTYFNK